MVLQRYLKTSNDKDVYVDRTIIKKQKNKQGPALHTT